MTSTVVLLEFKMLVLPSWVSNLQPWHLKRFLFAIDLFGWGKKHTTKGRSAGASWPLLAEESLLALKFNSIRNSKEGRGKLKY